jgi:nicotinamidase/pyrazinamidase
MPEPLVFVDVDTQVDFMVPTGKLYVPGAERLVPNLARLMNWARQHEIPVVSTADAHRPDDPEFKIWPPHCVVGTAGQRRIPETQFAGAVVIPRRPHAFTPPERWVGQFIIEKSTYDPQDNPNFHEVLGALGPRQAIVFGVATEFCLRASALALLRHGLPVDLVVDAIQGITEEGGRKALEEMTTAGARLVRTDEVLKPGAEPPRSSSGPAQPFSRTRR